MIFPVPVTLKRFAAPLCVFNFWFILFLFLLSLLRSKDRYQIRAFHFWPGFHGSNFRQFFNQSVDDRATDTLVHDLAPPEEDSCLHLVALSQEADDVILLEYIIVLVRIGTKLHFLDRDVLLMLPRLVFLLVLLVEILAVIHDSANRRVCSGCDF